MQRRRVFVAIMRGIVCRNCAPRRIVRLGDRHRTALERHPTRYRDQTTGGENAHWRLSREGMISAKVAHRARKGVWHPIDARGAPSCVAVRREAAFKVLTGEVDWLCTDWILRMPPTTACWARCFRSTNRASREAIRRRSAPWRRYRAKVSTWNERGAVCLVRMTGLAVHLDYSSLAIAAKEFAAQSFVRALENDSRRD